MDADRFDTLTRTIVTHRPRRRLLQGLAGGLVAALPIAIGGVPAVARKKHKKPRKPKVRQPPPTEPTCQPYLASCIPGGDCCSGSCAYFDLALNYCNKGDAGTPCHDNDDCLSASCRDFVCG